MRAKPYCCSMAMMTAPPPMPANIAHHLETCLQSTASVRWLLNLLVRAMHPLCELMMLSGWLFASLGDYHCDSGCLRSMTGSTEGGSYLRLDLGCVWIVQNGNDGGHAVRHARHHESKSKRADASHEPRWQFLLVVLPQPAKAGLSLFATASRLGRLELPYCCTIKYRHWVCTASFSFGRHVPLWSYVPLWSSSSKVTMRLK
jgi:hypothetical protein